MKRRSKADQRLIHCDKIAPFGIHKDIKVLSRSRLGMNAHGPAADNQILHTTSVERRQEIAKVGV